MYRTKVLLGLATACALALPMAAIAGASSTSPGTAPQIKALVASSVHIKTLTKTTAAELPAAPSDFSWAGYPKLGGSSSSQCFTATSCVYGDTSSENVVVLFGDSHALMWLPAIAPVAAAHKVRLVLLWTNLCPPASVEFYDPTNNDPASCDAWRAETIAIIQKLAPSLVVIGERATYIPSGPTTFFTSAQWQVGLTKTIREVKKGKTKVAVIESPESFGVAVPECLAANPTKVQACSMPAPKSTGPEHQAAEAAAAKATGSLFVKTLPWFCTTSLCSPVIGSFIVFIDTGHLSFSYAQYLSDVMGTALKRDL
jgi:hypothetical protein